MKKLLFIIAAFIYFAWQMTTVVTAAIPSNDNHYYVPAKSIRTASFNNQLDGDTIVLKGSNCIIKGIPFSEGFEDSTRIDNCWTFICTGAYEVASSTQYTGITPLLDQDGNNMGGDRVLRMGNPTGSPTPNVNNYPIFWAIMPPVADDLNISQLEFSADFMKYNNTTLSGGLLEIGILPDADHLTSFIVIDTIPIECFNYMKPPFGSGKTITRPGDTVKKWHHYIYSFEKYKGTGKCIAFRMSKSWKETFYIDNIILDSQENAACADPKEFTINDIGNHDARFIWKAGSSENSWTLEYKKTTDSEWKSITVNEPEYLAKNLFESNTHYDVRLKSNCSETQHSRWILAEFNTLLDCAMPTKINVSNITPHTAKISWNPGLEETQWEINYTTDSTVSWESIISNNTEYMLENLIHSSDYTLRIRAICNDSQHSDWSYTAFRTEASCPVPQNIVITSITENMATLTWDNGSDEKLWEVAYRPANEMAWAEQISTESKVATLKGLKSGTQYIVGIRAKCDHGIDNDYSSWAEQTFITLFDQTNDTCVISNFPYFEDFESGIYPSCWSKLLFNNNSQDTLAIYAHEQYTKDITDDNGNPVVDDFGNLVGGKYEVSFGWPGSKADIYAILPPIDNSIDIRTLELSGYFFKRTYYSNCDSYLTIGVMEDPHDITTFQVIDTLPIIVTNGYSSGGNGINLTGDTLFGTDAPYRWHFYSVSLANYTGNGKYIAIRQSKGSQNGFHFDNITVNFSENAACADPKNLTVNNLTNHTADIAWEASGDESSWEVEYSSDNENWKSSIVEESLCTLTDLQSFTTYKVRVKALCSKDETSRWISKSFITIADCPAPRNVKIENIKAHSATVTWEAGADENLWLVKYQAQGTDTWDSIQVSETKIELTKLTAATEYTFSVSALCSELNISLFTTKKFTTGIACPSPTDAFLSNATNNSASITWVPGDAEKKWTIHLYTDTDSNILTDSNVTKPEYTFENLEQGTNYMVDIIADCIEDGTSNAFTFPFTTLISCYAPADFTTQFRTDTSAMLKWTPYDDVKNWELQYSTDQTNWNSTNISSTPEYLLTGLMPETHYYTRIRTICSKEDQSNWVYVEFDTRQHSCLPPSPITITNITDNNVLVSWNDTGFGDTWTLQYKVQNTTTWSDSIKTSEPSLQLTDLESFTYYEVQILSNCNSNRKSAWNSQTFRTGLKDTCAVPADVKVGGHISVYSYIVTWSQAEGTANEWEVNYRRTSDNEEWIHKIVTTNSAILDSLHADSEYEVMVIAHCINGLYSDNSKIIKFTTPRPAIQDFLSGNINLFPNPTTGVITCNVKDLNVERVEVYDVYGKLLNAFNTNESVIRIDASSFANGMYFVRIYTEQGNAHKAFIKK